MTYGNGLEYLRKLTNELPEFPPVGFQYNNYKEIKIENGICRLWDIFWSPQISVNKFFVTANSYYHNHKHEGVETIYVYEGKMVLDFEDGRGQKTIGVGQSYYIESGVVHRAYYPEECAGIAIVIPAEVYYNANK